MSGALVVGLVNGMAYALLAAGVVLVFKAGRYLNFAQAQLGVLSAVILARLVITHGWPYLPAVLLCLALACAIGMLVEFAVMRRLKSKSAVSRLLLTVGVAQLLLAMTFVKFLQADSSDVITQGYPVPFQTSFTVGGFVLRGHHVLTLVLAPLMIAALAGFLRYTMAGRNLRAVASNPDAARLAGVSVGRVHLSTWAIAGLLSGVAAILQAPGQVQFSSASLGPGILLRGLGAAAIAGFVNLPAATVAAVGLGVVEGLAIDVLNDVNAAEPIVLLAVLVGLLVRAKAVNRGLASPLPPPVDDRPLRIPDVLRDRFVVRHWRRLLVAAWVVVGVGLPYVPFFDDNANRFRLTLIAVYALLGISLTLLLGWAGQVSLGQYALLGVGAYTAAQVAPRNWSLPAMLLAAGLVGAGVAVIVGLPAVRIRGLTLAVTTLGLGVLGPAWLFKQRWLGSTSTLDVASPYVPGIGRLNSQLSLYFAAVVVLALSAFAVSRLRRLAPGRLVVAVRDNETAAVSYGVAPVAVKLAAFAVSGFIAGTSGVLWAVSWRHVSPELFGAENGLLILGVPIIGGLGSVSGAMLGSLAVYGITFFLSEPLHTIVPNSMGITLAIAGSGLVFAQLRHPGGLASALRHVFEHQLARWAARVEAARPDEPLAEPAAVPAPKPFRFAPERPAEADAGLPLDAEGVSVTFGGLVAVDGVSIRVGPGEIVGLIGTNGAGKTTFLNAVSGLVPAEGVVRVHGVDVSVLAPEHRAHVGLGRTFQEARLFPGLTVREAMQVAMARHAPVGVLSAVLGAPWVPWVDTETAAAADDVMARFGLTRWADTPTSDLSTGTRRICDLAMQACARPRVLLLDEPTAGVAQREAEQFGRVVRDLRQELDCAVLIIEHDMPLLMGLADRLYCLEAGRVIAEGTPEEIRSDARVVASYLGTDETAIERSGRREPAHIAKGDT